MIFSSLQFVGLFFPVVFLLYVGISTWKNTTACLFLLFVASLIFYATWNPPYVILLLISIIINYAFGTKISMGTNKKWLLLGVGWNILLIGYYKYANFFIDTINNVGGNFSIETIVLPLGISFYTFQQIAYLIDLYKGKTQQSSFLSYAVFVSFFPQLIAGPIVQHQQITQQLQTKLFEKLSMQNIVVGCMIFIVGLAKKTILADSLSGFANGMFHAATIGGPLTFYDAWGGVWGYTLQLYFDFSGYMDMAIGLALFFGISLPVNFNSPYKSVNISEFWRRWHITLSQFFREYVYIPLGGNRGSLPKVMRNVLITMTLCGLWHGAGWTFVFWGLLQGIYLAIFNGWKRCHITLPKIVGWLLTMLSIMIGWIFFRAETFESALYILRTLASPDMPNTYVQHITSWWAGGGVRFPDWIYGILFGTIGLFIALFMPNTQQIFANYVPSDARNPPAPLWLQWKPSARFAVAFSFLSFLGLTFLILYQESEFLYFQF